MALNLKVLAQRLRRARELQAIELSTVCQKTGITHERLSQIESVQCKPSGDEVLILANYYHVNFRDFLNESGPESFEQTEILYRRHGDDFRSDDRRAIQEFLYLCETESFLEAELKIQKHKFAFVPTGKHFKTHGMQAAGKLRSFLGYAANEIPRDIFNDFRQIGFHVFRRKLTNSNISGLYIYHPNAGHCLLINYEEDIYRQRFSASHEAAHAIFDSSESVVVSYKPGKGDYSAQELKEIRANRFASCYLIPPDQLPKVSQWSKYLALNWAQQLRVSTAVLSFSLKEAGLVDESTAKLIRSFSVPTSDKIDPEAPQTLTEKQRSRRLNLLESGLSDYYVGLCFEAYHQGIISAGRLSEALLADHAETQEISILFGRSLQYGV
ncbi:MAG: XRE family transcriptional regulator [Methylobacter sp.]|uniref:XRE family transcriptional regulator n=1 Tax=Candidatus Methylobacter titanis TaxID=3053457 RepID=A0AA43Q504_9GAMM|nr:XRE family transcriptional regulator [Candidatus Methylobacter titanis]